MRLSVDFNTEYYLVWRCFVEVLCKGKRKIAYCRDGFKPHYKLANRGDIVFNFEFETPSPKAQERLPASSWLEFYISLFISVKDKSVDVVSLLIFWNDNPSSIGWLVGCTFVVLLVALMMHISIFKRWIVRHIGIKR